MGLRVAETFIVFLALGIYANAEIVKIREYRVHQPRDRNVKFQMAVTPDQDLLSFVPKSDGKYRLTRVRGWLDKKPEDETIEVPGWSEANGPRGIFLNVIVSPDGDFAACIATGIWIGRRDDLISLIDLRAFRVVKTIHSPFEEIDTRFYLDGNHLLVQSRTPVSTPQRLFDARRRLVSISSKEVNRFGKYDVRFMLLGLTNLENEAQCRFTETSLAQLASLGEVVTDFRTRVGVDGGDCDDLLKRSSRAPITLNDYIKSLNPEPHRHGQDCLVADVSRDGKYERATCGISNKNWWGTFVERRRWWEISAHEEKVGSVEEPTNDTLQTAFAYQGDGTYVLALHGGTLLTVYEVKK